jgi:hypothetical protein
LTTKNAAVLLESCMVKYRYNWSVAEAQHPQRHCMCALGAHSNCCCCASARGS